jgi:MoaA/NifB/PqqE/SkfB family radical SAM enzyme
MLQQIHASKIPGWHKRRFWQVLHSIAHYIAELRDIDSLREAIDWAYFKNPYFFKLRKYPPRATVEFTNHCNFGCGYCPRSLMARPEGNMDVKFFESLASDLDEKGCSVLKIGGLGEPVLHPEFSQMMAALRGRRMKAFLYTNGTLFKHFTPEQICEWNINSVVLSIDGLDATSFEKQRKGGKYSEIRNGAFGFAGHRSRTKPIFEVRHVILPNESSADLRAFKKDWLQLADTVKFNYLLPLRPHGAAVPSGVRCRDVRREIYVRWDGRLLLCAGQDRQHPPQWLGDATKNSISELWFDVRLQDLRGAHDRREPNPPMWCKNCSFR